MGRILLIAVLLLPASMAGVARAGEAPPGTSQAPAPRAQNAPEAAAPPEPERPLISGNRFFFAAGANDQPFIFAGIGLNGGVVLALAGGANFDDHATPHKFSVLAGAYAAYAIWNVRYFAMGPEVFFLADLGASPSSTFTIRPGYTLLYSSAALPFVIGFGLDVDFIFSRDHFRFSVVTPGVRFVFGI